MLKSSELFHNQAGKVA